MNRMSLVTMPVEMARHLADTDAPVDAEAAQGGRSAGTLAVAMVLVAACAGLVFGLIG